MCFVHANPESQEGNRMGEKMISVSVKFPLLEVVSGLYVDAQAWLSLLCVMAGRHAESCFLLVAVN